MLYSIELRSQGLAGPEPGIVLLGGGLLDDSLGLFDTGLLTGEVAEVEYAGPADLTYLVDLYFVDERALVRENPLNADAVGYLADSERPGVRGGSANLDDHAAEVLQSVFISFFNPVGYGDGITGLECRIGGRLVLREGFLHQFNQIHSIFQNKAQRHWTVQREAASNGTAKIETFF